MAKEPTATKETESNSPKQPTVQVRQPPSDQTKTIRTNDPVTNQTEQQMAEAQEAEDQQLAEEEQKKQEEQAKKEQEEFQKRQDLMVEIIKSPEGFVARSEENNEAMSLALAEGLIYFSNVQSGPGGLEVEERAFLSSKGYDALKTTLGPSMGK